MGGLMDPHEVYDNEFQESQSVYRSDVFYLCRYEQVEKWV